MKEKIFYGILAGVFISMAAVAYLVSANAVVGSVLFAFGLLTIVNYNFQLFTGAAGYISAQETLKNTFSYSFFVLGVWFWNLVGSLIVGTLVSNTRTYRIIYPKLDALMTTKCGDSSASLLILGIFCGILMFIAVNTYKRTEAPPVAKVVLLFACVVVFILSGYEHCVANMGYIALYQKFNSDIIRVLLVTSCGNIIGCNLIPLSLRLSRPKI